MGERRTLFLILIGLIVVSAVAFVTTVSAKRTPAEDDEFIRVKPKKEYMVMGSYAPVMVYEVELGGKGYIITQGGFMTGICKK